MLKELLQQSSKKPKPINETETRTELEPISPEWRKRQQNKGKFPLTSNPSKERTMKPSDEPNWRSRKWEKPIQEVESPSITPITEASIKEIKMNDEDKQT